MRYEKRIERLLSCPADYKFSELIPVLQALGYELYNKGATSGSRVAFYRQRDGHKIFLHRPHPGDIMVHAAVKAVIKQLRDNGDIL